MAHPGNHYSYGFSDDADIILRSSDNVDFYVIGAFLRYVSLVFKHMFASSESDNDEKKDNLPVVPVAEDSETLCLLLDIIYPYKKKPQLSSPFIAWKVSKATQKYMIDMIESKLKRQIANSKLIAEKPLSMYAIAIDLGWEEMALDAARRTLTTPLQELAYVDELQCITGAGFYRFLEYRCLCENSKNPREEVLPPLRRHRDSIETRTNGSESSDTPHYDHHIEDIPFATASEPYTRSELSDLILRTPDGVNFYVVAALLRLSSPFFNRKFPLENPVMKDGLAVIDIQEDSNVLFLLLGFVYPMQEPEIQSAGLYAHLVFAARKYEMMDIENKVKKHATASSLVSAEPVRVYAVASALDWTSLAKTAALNTLHTPFQELSFGDEMHFMTGTQLFRLMRFRFVCANAACDVLEPDTCRIYGFQGSVLQSVLENKTLGAVLSERLNACPRGSTITNAYDEGVSKCIAEVTRDRDGSSDILIIFKILRCLQETPKAVEEAVSKVDFVSCLY
ncbi:hypothetical protein M378DRAFT_7888 [Amanita muscaria Koide BX008]|uniref:BTB domain-containing protein n=1 Tax=Amanita muscaria (strain Koide BX008) TaxID=946122 RepID=A0A0C2XJF1_AMAMK|nr:hypothetical protein M378DRAFT_7888 [Amanita muscaria Koide BX008]